MSTRCYIGYVDRVNGDVVSCYVHFDGYPSYMGVQLKTWFNDYDKVRLLVSRGDRRIVDQYSLYAADDYDECMPKRCSYSHYIGMPEDSLVDYMYLFGEDDVWMVSVDCQWIPVEDCFS